MVPTEPLTIPIPLRTRDERRQAQRFVASMPVSVDGHAGKTQDLSAGGLSFVVDRAYALGARVEVVIEYLLDGHNYPLRCEAEVLRVDADPEGFRIGARLMPRFGLQDVQVGDDDATIPAGPSPQRLRRVD